MYVEKTAEYAVGHPKRKLMRKLNRKREKRSPWSVMLAMFGTTGSAIGGTTYLAYMINSPVAGSVVTCAFILALCFGGATWSTMPEFRRDKILKMLWDDKVIDPNDILYRLVLTEEVVTWLLAEKANGHENGACKRAVDAFIAEFAQYRESYSKVRKPEDAELITEEWEQEHGPLFEHPLVVAIQDAICDNGDLQCHVYDTVMELREKHRSKQEAEREKRIDELTAERKELEKKLEQNGAALGDLDALNQKCLTG